MSCSVARSNREIFRDGDASGDGVVTAVDWRSMHPMNSEFRRKNGSLIDVVCTLHPLERDDVGSILLTFRERTREPVEAIALKDIEAKFGAVFDTMPDGLIVIDENGLIGFFSSGAERLFDYRRSEVLGRNVAMLMPSHTGRRMTATLQPIVTPASRRSSALDGKWSDGAKMVQLSRCICPLAKYGWRDDDILSESPMI